MHWVLDVVFREDESRIRKDNAPINMAMLRQLCLNLLRQDKTHKRGLKTRRLRAALDEDYLVKLIAGKKSNAIALVLLKPLINEYTRPERISSGIRER